MKSLLINIDTVVSFLDFLFTCFNPKVQDSTYHFWGIKNFDELMCTVDSILETQEFKFPAKTVFANNSKNDLRVRFLVRL